MFICSSSNSTFHLGALPRDRISELPAGVAYMRKPWQPLNVLIAAEEALASRM
jgi:hypothetical protein